MHYSLETCLEKVISAWQLTLGIHSSVRPAVWISAIDLNKRVLANVESLRILSRNLQDDYLIGSQTDISNYPHPRS